MGLRTTTSESVEVILRQDGIEVASGIWNDNDRQHNLDYRALVTTDSDFTMNIIRNSGNNSLTIDVNDLFWGFQTYGSSHVAMIPV